MFGTGNPQFLDFIVIPVSFISFSGCVTLIGGCTETILLFSYQNNLPLLQTQQGVLAAGVHRDDTLDREHFPRVFLLSCHIPKKHVRSHPDEQAAEKLRLTVVGNLQQLLETLETSLNVSLLHLTAKMLNHILVKLYRHVKPISCGNREAVIVVTATLDKLQ